ncbi:hypothetical protein CF326_g2123 [Tilletia indica]|nr:hypothetical protein CF326_g2123 [Tilletia indica]
MTAVLRYYSPELFQSLPSVGQAAAGFKELGGLSIIEAVLAAMARKHPSARNFGVQLLHRHSDLDEDEIMLAYGSTTIPVKKSEISEASKENVCATIWGIHPDGNKLLPLEFAFVENADDKLPNLDQELAMDFIRVLKQLGLENVLGLALVKPGQELGLETTHGRANIVLPANLIVTSANSIDVLWPLSALGGDSPTLNKCVQTCWTNIKGGHSEIHKRQS